MKYFLLIIGIAPLFFAGYAEAATCPSGDVEDILNLDPVYEEYTGKILERAEDGIAYALSAPDLDLEIPYLYLSWLDEVVSAMTALIDTDSSVSNEEIDFRQHSPCLFADLLLLEAEIEKVRCELSTGTVSSTTVNPLKIIRLKSLLHFLNERHRILSDKGLDPTYEDKGWQQKHAFDEPSTSWCSIMYGPEGENYICKSLSEEECWEEGGTGTFDTETACLEALGYSPEDENQDDAERMCPFHSDYLPPTSYGFGCDSSVLREYYNHSPIKEEYDALKKLTEKRNAFIENVADLKQLTIDLAEFMDRPIPNLDNFGMAIDVEHNEFFGCIDRVENPVVRTNKSQKNIVYQKGATFVELRGPFSIEKNEPKIWREFLELRRDWGSAREHADLFKLPGEFTDDDEREQAEKDDKRLAPYNRIIRDDGRTYMESWKREQSARESASIGKAFDVPLSTSLQFEPLQKEVQTMALLATSISQGSRRFTRNFAWFLRASCIFRPCSEQLEKVLKIVFQSACFPYSKGAKLPEDYEIDEDRSNDPEMKCMRAADLLGE